MARNYASWILYVCLLFSACELQAAEIKQVSEFTLPGTIESLSWNEAGQLAALSKIKTPRISTIFLLEPGIDEVPKPRLTAFEALFSVQLLPNDRATALSWPHLSNQESRWFASHLGIYDLKTGKQEKVLQTVSTENETQLGYPMTSELLTTAISPSGQHVAAVGKLVSDTKFDRGQHMGGEVCVWDVESGLLWSDRLTHGDIAYGVVFSPDGKLVASGGKDLLIRIWNAQTGELKKTLAGAVKAGIQSLDWSADGQYIASGGVGDLEGGVVRVWRVETCEVVQVFRDFLTAAPVKIAFAPNSHHLYAAAPIQLSEDKEKTPLWQIKCHDVSTGQLVGESVVASKDAVNALAISLDGNRIAVGTFDGKILIYNALLLRE